MDRAARLNHDTAHRIFYGGLAVAYVGVLAGWIHGNHASLGFDASGLISIARLFGLLAASSVLLQVFFMSRVPLIDQHFNLHEIVRVHRWNGFAVVTFISLHVICMTVGYAGVSDTGLFRQFLDLVTTFRDVFKALLGAILIFTATTLSIGFARRRVPYEFWYYVHLTLYAAILLIFFHQINTGGDIIRGDWFRYYWLGLYIFVFGVWGYYRALRIGLLLLRHDFHINRIVQEAEGIYSVYVGGRSVEKFQYRPGQYAGWRFLTWQTWWQHHPYSFSSPQVTKNTVGDMADKAELRFTINQADGPFTRGIPEMKPGTRLLLDGPRGSFTADRVAGSRVVLIAGGIGVAPYIALIPQLLELGRDVHLLYAARTFKHAAFGPELTTMQKQGLRLRYFYADAGQKISMEALQEYIEGDTTFFICGPPAMVRDLRETLDASGVSHKRIVTERFSV